MGAWIKEQFTWDVIMLLIVALMFINQLWINEGIEQDVQDQCNTYIRSHYYVAEGYDEGFQSINISFYRSNESEANHLLSLQ